MYTPVYTRQFARDTKRLVRRGKNMEKFKILVHAVPLDGYRIDIRTSSGVAGIFDVKPYLKGSAFKELENTSYFRQVTPAHQGIRWPNEQDFSSDTIIWDIQNAQQSGGGDGITVQKTRRQYE